MSPSRAAAALFALTALAALAIAATVRDARAETAATSTRVAQSEPRTPSRQTGKPPATRPPGPTSPPSKPRPVICIGGKVVSGLCVCPRGWSMFRASARVHVCRKPKVDPPAKPDPPGRTPPPAPPAKPRPQHPAQLPPQHPALPPPGGPARIAPGPPAVTPGSAIGATDVFVVDEVVALAAPGASATTGSDVARDFGLVLIDETAVALTGDRVLRFRIPDGRDVQTVVAALAADPRVEGPQQNFVYRAQQGSAAKPPSPPDLQYALAKVDLAEAHTLATGAGVIVAVIDSGVDATHPDLAGAVEAELDVTGGSPRKGQSADPHGTAIAGIIAARGLVRGIAPAARILSLRAFSPGLAGAPATATTVILVTAMDRALSRGAAILNLSFAGPADPLLHRLVKAVAAKGGMIVAAAGNKGPDAPPVYPGGYPEVIAVTATDAADRLYAKANRGAYIAVAAPGVDVLAPGVAKSHQMQSGTSFAAALVSGILALMRERTPGLTLDDARHALTAAAIDLGTPGPDAEFGAGRVNATGALRALGASRR